MRSENLLCLLEGRRENCVLTLILRNDIYDIPVVESYPHC
jgi:hypothetical protein